MRKVAINGLGRIGRATLKIILSRKEFELAVVNDLVPVDNLVYLLQYDTVYGRYEKEIRSEPGRLVIDGKKYPVLSEKDPANLPWKELGVDIVFECTGLFTRKEDAAKHITAGAKHVLISAPSKSEDVTTVVYGTTEKSVRDQVVSCASCTTNCITPVVEIIGRRAERLKSGTHPILFDASIQIW